MHGHIARLLTRVIISDVDPGKCRVFARVMNICAHTHTHTHTLSLTHTHTHMRIHTHTHTHAHTNAHTHTLTTRLSDIPHTKNALCPSFLHTHTQKASPSPHRPEFLVNACMYFFGPFEKKKYIQTSRSTAFAS